MAINFPDSPSNGDQYVVAGNTYTWNGVSWDATGSAGSSGSANIANDIDNHLNTSSANTGEVLSWNGSDYDWVADQTGGGGGGVNSLSDGDKGDITVSNSGATWSIDDGVVNAAALAADAVTTDKILNNSVTVGKISATGSPSSSTYLRGDGSWSAVSGGGGGSSTFIGLTDTPSSFTADKWLKVNSAANALEFVDAPSGGGGGGSSDPVGTIVAWAGSVANIPSDYQLCDGSAASTSELQAITGANVPDLRDRFVIGASDSTGDTTYPGLSPGSTGGSADATLVSHSHTVDSHSHGSGNLGTNNAGNHRHSGTIPIPWYTGDTDRGTESSIFSSDNSQTQITDYQGDHNHSISGSTGSASPATDSQGSTATNANLPPYYALCYIIKHTATSSGSSTFTGLTDTPSSLGSAGQVAAVNSGGTALEFIDLPSGGGGGSSDPVGTIVAWSGASSTIPSEYQLCDGAAAQTTELQAITGANVPDLRDRFIVGASDTTGDTSYPGLSPGGTGGSADAILVSHSHTINNHTHSFSGSGSDTVSISISGTTGNQSQNHTHVFGANTYGGQGGSTFQAMDNPQPNGGGQKTGTTSGISQDHTHSFSASGSGTANISISGTTGNPSDTGTNTQGSSATNANLPPYYSLCYIVKHTATSGSGGGSSTTIISPVAYAVVGTNSAGSGTGMSWGAYDSSTGQVVFTFDAAQPDTDYYVHTNREHFATHNIEVLSKSTTGFTTKWTNSDTSLLPPGTFKGVLIVYASTPTKTVGGGGGSNSGITTANINADTLNVSGISTFAGITTVTGQTLFSNQLSVSGISTYNGLVHVSGNNKLNLGNLNDLYLQWEENSQSATLQASATGNLYFSNTSNGGIFLNAGSGNQSGVHLYPSDRVELRHAATKRLETTSDGVQVTGTLAADVNVVGTFTFTANGSSNYIFTGTGYPGTWTDNNTMYLHLGLTYKFINATGSSHPLEFTDNTGNSPNNGYNDGWITGSKTGVQYVTIPYNMGGNYVMNYRCTIHSGMGGQIQIVS